MGAIWGSGQSVRGLQMVCSAVKVPMLLLVTFVIALPSFFVLNTLLGVRGDFGRSVRALLATQAGLTIILASLAPVTMAWYASSADYDQAVLFNAVMFGMATVGSQRLLKRHYRPLIERNPVHRKLMWAWLVLYAFVGIQMGWTLRPFIGHPDEPTRFFRQAAWGNAYEEVFTKVAMQFGR